MRHSSKLFPSLRRRLVSRRGASIIIALVFFLICAFVGGTVLAAATANGGRIGTRKTAQQDFFSQRSAAQLLQEQFTANGSNVLIVTKTTTVVSKTATTGTVYDTPVVALNFSAPDGASGISRVLYQAAVRQYLAQNVSSGITLTFRNFKFGGSAEPTSVSGFCPLSGTLAVTLKDSSGASLSQLASSYAMGADSASPYAFDVLFGDGSSQMALSLPATVQQTNPSPSITTDYYYDYYQTTTVTASVTTISWGDPVIAKGDAA